jgi:hypothetical protein
LAARIELEGKLSAQAFIDPAVKSLLHRLPLVTLYLTERCNSRCVTCDYWRYGRADMSFDAIKRMLPSLERLGTQVALLSGGEPLLNPDWAPIAELLRADIRLIPGEARPARRRVIPSHHRVIGRHRSGDLPGDSRLGRAG